MKQEQRRLGVVPSLRRNNQLYAVSLMERTGGYGPSDMGSIPVLRAILITCYNFRVSGHNIGVVRIRPLSGGGRVITK